MNKIMSLLNSLFNKPRCSKFFTYATKKIDIKGLSAGLPTGSPDIGIKLGEITIEPEFVKVSELLMQKDQQQYDLCVTIANISDTAERDRKFSQLADIKMEMMRMAANPEAYENSAPVTKDIPKEQNPIDGKQILGNAGKNIMQLLDNPATIVEALQLAEHLPYAGSDRFLFNQKLQKYSVGMSDYERLNWIGEMQNFLEKYI